MSTYIIAEIGCNHNGDVEIAKEMVRQVAAAGCNAAKFQVFHADKLASRYAESAEYQKKNLKSDETQFEMLQKLELGKRDFVELRDLCESLGIEFFATPFDCDSVDELEELGVDRYKIGSGDVTDMSMLRRVGQTGKPVILSTGMSTYDEIDEAIGWLEQEGRRDITLLHCTSNYPTAYEDVNMRMMGTLTERYGRPVGYSDHSIGLEIPVMAVALGATTIEKHVTLDRNMHGPDHKASLELKDLPTMVSMIRHVEQAFGVAEKQLLPHEVEVRNIARKSLVATRALKRGDIVGLDDVIAKRPATGIAPKYINKVIGSTMLHDVEEDVPLTADDVEMK